MSRNSEIDKGFFREIKLAGASDTGAHTAVACTHPRSTYLSRIVGDARGRANHTRGYAPTPGVHARAPRSIGHPVTVEVSWYRLPRDHPRGPRESDGKERHDGGREGGHEEGGRRQGDQGTRSRRNPARPTTHTPSPKHNFWRQISPRSTSRKSSTPHHHAHHAITHEPASDRPYSTIVTPTAG